MRLEFYSSEKLGQEIKNIVGRYLDINQYRIFFFGSRVSGKGNERSDIDIGIEGSEKIPLRTMSKIKEEVEDLPILYKIDIVDFKNVSSDFYEIAIKNIEIL